MEEASHVRVEDKQVFIAFKKYCKINGIKMGHLVTSILREYLEKNK